MYDPMIHDKLECDRCHRTTEFTSNPDLDRNLKITGEVSIFIANESDHECYWSAFYRNDWLIVICPYCKAEVKYKDWHILVDDCYAKYEE